MAGWEMGPYLQIDPLSPYGKNKTSRKLPPISQGSHDAQLAAPQTKLDLLKCQFQQKLEKEKQVKLMAIYKQQYQDALYRLRTTCLLEAHSGPWTNSGIYEHSSADVTLVQQLPPEEQDSAWTQVALGPQGKRSAGIDRSHPLRPIDRRNSGHSNILNLEGESSDWRNLISLDAPMWPAITFRPSPPKGPKDKCQSSRSHLRTRERCIELRPLEDSTSSVQLRQRSSQHNNSACTKGQEPKEVQNSQEIGRQNIEVEICKKESLIQGRLRKIEEELRQIQMQRDQVEEEEMEEKNMVETVRMERGRSERERSERERSERERSERERSERERSERERSERERSGRERSERERSERERSERERSERERSERERSERERSGRERPERERSEREGSERERSGRERPERERSERERPERERPERERPERERPERERPERERPERERPDRERPERERSERERAGRERPERERSERQRERERSERERAKRDRTERERAEREREEKEKLVEMEREAKQRQRERLKRENARDVGDHRAAKGNSEKSYKIKSSGHSKGEELIEDSFDGCSSEEYTDHSNPFADYKETASEAKDDTEDDMDDRAHSRGSPQNDGAEWNGHYSPEEKAHCPFCGRRFVLDRLSTHTEICKKVFKRKRKIYDSAQKRAKGTDLENYQCCHKIMPAPKVNWKQKHDAFIRMLHAAQEIELQIYRGKKGNTTAPCSSLNPDYVQCPHCSRRFERNVAQSHIPKCKTLRSRPAPPKR
ncbi:uncharacterized protein [Heterodontus francisci]|uniref:uncharacterized protein n=1 Tax=Heterodontus francisci TaxID=7792 RepID=UPI00355BEB56